MVILLTGTACPNILDWNVTWQKVIPYTIGAAGAAGIAFGAWVHKNASSMSEESAKKAKEEAVTTLLNSLKSQGINVDNQGTLLSIKTKAVAISYAQESIDVDVYYKNINTLRIFSNPSESELLMNITNYTTGPNSNTQRLIGIVHSALFNFLVKDEKNLEQWYILDESRGNLQFNDHQQAQKALDCLSKLD